MQNYLNSLVLINMNNGALLLSAFILLTLSAAIKSESTSNDIEASQIKRKLTKSQILPTVRKLRKQSQSKSQFRRKIKPTRATQKQHKIAKNGRKLKSEVFVQKRQKIAKKTTEISSGKSEVHKKHRLLRKRHETGRSKKTRREIKPIRKATVKRIRKKTARRMSLLRKKTRPQNDDSGFREKIVPPKVITNPVVDAKKAEIDAEIELRRNGTRFLEIVAGEKFTKYYKCDTEGPRIIPKNYIKLHDGHVPIGRADCRNEMSDLHEAVLGYSKKSEHEKREDWREFQRQLNSEYGYPKRCKHWRYGTDC